MDVRSARPAARVTMVHAAVAGRVRVSIRGLRRSEQLRIILERDLTGRNGIRKVSPNVLTGNTLILYDRDDDLALVLATLEAVLESAESSPAAPPSPSPKPARGAGLLGFLGNLFARKSVARRVKLEPRVVPEQLPWHSMSARQVAQHWHTSLRNGLPSSVAAERLREYGSNSLPAYQGRSPLAMIVAQFKSLPVLLLLGSAAVSVVTGGVGDAVVILIVVALNASIGFATEAQAERVIASLLDVDEPPATVVRDGRVLRISGEDVVPGDLLVITRGSQVVADARVLQAERLTTDESALTGESMPVEKAVPEIGGDFTPVAQRTNMLFRGTVVTGGSGLALVVATGAVTEIGEVQRLIAESPRPDTPLERQLGTLSNQLVWATVAIAGTALAIGLLRGFSLLQMLSGSIALAVAAVPEGLPVVATTALANAVRGMLRDNVLIRRLDAIEALGVTQVVCFDKTGTLTLNRMSVASVFADMRQFTPEADGRLCEAGPELTRLLEVCALCSEAELSGTDGVVAVTGSPTETALIDMALSNGVDVAAVRESHPLVRTQHRAEGRNYMVSWHDDGERTIVAVKGNPDEVLALCDSYSRNGRVCRLTKRTRSVIKAENARMADGALRVLGCASAEEDSSERGRSVAGLTWHGLVGMADPPREGMPAFIRRLRAAGIRPVMITGDQRSTADAVSRTLGLNGGSANTIMDAATLEALGPDELAGHVSGTDVFARVNPSHKLRIVRALQNGNRVVAMTGDGINDGPALKAADVGITLGQTGTQVAREVADVVLLDDNIQTLLRAIREGRRIHENIRTAIHYICATNTSEVALMLLSLAFGLGQPLNARQLLWINVVTDIFPELAVAVQPAEADIMRRPPRDPNAPVIGAEDLPRLARQSGIITAAGLGCYLYGIARYGISPQASTVAFLGLAAPQLLHAFSARSATHTMFESGVLAPNRFLTASVAGALALLTFGQLVPGVRGLLGAAPIGIADYLVCAAAGAASLLANEMFKAAGSSSVNKTDTCATDHRSFRAGASTDGLCAG